MKKIIALVLALMMVLALVACAAEEGPKSETKTAEKTQTATTETDNVTVMTYAEYIAAELDDEVVIEGYVQGKQSWWEDKATVYLQDKDGAYFVYKMTCSEEDYAKLTDGVKIRVTGYKTEWSGEVEVAEGATFEFVEGADTYIAEAVDVTELLGTDELITKQNMFVSFKGLTVVARTDAEGNEVAFQYGYDGSGSRDSNSDLYFDVSDGTNTYTFTVESYLCDNTTDVYAAVEGLAIGDTIDLEGFLYWYNDVNPHITSVVAAN